MGANSTLNNEKSGVKNKRKTMTRLDENAVYGDGFIKPISPEIKLSTERKEKRLLSINGKTNSTKWEIFRRKMILKNAFYKILKYCQIFHSQKDGNYHLQILRKTFSKMKTYCNMRIKNKVSNMNAYLCYEKYHKKKKYFYGIMK